MGRVRITRPFVLLALAVLLAPRVEASRTSVWESNPPSALTTTKTDAAGLLASLAPAGPLESTAANVDLAESSRFDLGHVVLVERELEHEERFHLGPLILVDLNLLRGPPPSYPETRVGGFELLPPFRIGASPRLSLWSRQACGFSCREVVSDSRYDPWGLCAFGLPCPAWAQKRIDSLADSAVDTAQAVGRSAARSGRAVAKAVRDTAGVYQREGRKAGLEAVRTLGEFSEAVRVQHDPNASPAEKQAAWRQEGKIVLGTVAAIEGLRGALTGGGARPPRGAAEAPAVGDEIVGAESYSTPWGTRSSATGKFMKGPRAGIDPVDSFIEEAERNGFEVLGREISVKTPFETRRLDVVLRNSETGQVGGIEIKSSMEEFLKFKKEQFAADRYINQTGAEAVGENARAAGVRRIDSVMKVLWEGP